MKRGFSLQGIAALWSRNLMIVAVLTFVNRFGQGLFGAVRTNFFVDTLGLTGGQVLWLEGVREIPGLALMFVAAFMVRLPLARRAAFSVLIMGAGYMLYAAINSYVALLVFAAVASLGLHMYMPLGPSLGMCLSTKETCGRVLGLLSSVGSMASIIGLATVSLMTGFVETISLRIFFLVGGAFVIVAALLLFKLPADVGATAAKQPRMVVKKRYWVFYVLNFMEGSRKEVLGTFVSLVLVQDFGLKVWQLSTLLVFSSIMNLIAAPYIGYLVDRFGERATMTARYLALALCCIGYATLNSVWLLVAVMFIVKLMLILGMGLNTYVNRIAPPEELTATLSTGVSINHVTSVAMPLIAGALLPIVGYQWIFMGTAILILLSVPFSLAMKVDLKAEPAPQVSTALAD